jgi:hypothetical protein
MSPRETRVAAPIHMAVKSPPRKLDSPTNKLSSKSRIPRKLEVLRSIPADQRQPILGSFCKPFLRKKGTGNNAIPITYNLEPRI